MNPKKQLAYEACNEVYRTAKEIGDVDISPYLFELWQAGYLSRIKVRSQDGIHAEWHYAKNLVLGLPAGHKITDFNMAPSCDVEEYCCEGLLEVDGSIYHASIYFDSLRITVIEL